MVERLYYFMLVKTYTDIDKLENPEQVGNCPILSEGSKCMVARGDNDL